MNGYEWQTVALFIVLAVLAGAALLYVHRSEAYKRACLLDLISEEGKISSRKFMEFGGFVVSTVVVVICAIRGNVPAEMVALVGVYASVFVLGRAAGQAIHTAGNTVTRKAAITRWHEVDYDVDEVTHDDAPARVQRQQRRSVRVDPEADGH